MTAPPGRHVRSTRTTSCRARAKRDRWRSACRRCAPRGSGRSAGRAAPRSSRPARPRRRARRPRASWMVRPPGAHAREAPPGARASRRATALSGAPRPPRPAARRRRPCIGALVLGTVAAHRDGALLGLAVVAMTSMKGTLRSSASRILRPTDSVRASTSARAYPGRPRSACAGARSAAPAWRSAIGRTTACTAPATPAARPRCPPAGSR